MKPFKIMILFISHIAIGVGGFSVGIYVLPILTAPEAPALSQVQAMAQQARYQGMFRRDLKGSDFLHWGEGEVFVSNDSIVLHGELAPGPDYHLYLSPEFVETEEDFLRLKSAMAHIGEVKTFKNFIVPVGVSVDIHRFNTVIVWCESFGQFISAARYQ
ncbi:MAG: DM13 domain-containing protein [Chromatiales bacterium]|jgi:hypothetical protein